MAESSESLHGSAFSHGGSGCVILGASGTGKSKLVADVMMMGGRLIADDQLLFLNMMNLLAVAPVPELQGILELRHLGLVKINDILTKHIVHLVVELDASVQDRLPVLEQREYLGIAVPYLRLPPVPFTSATNLLIYLKAMQENRVLPADWMPKAAS